MALSCYTSPYFNPDLPHHTTKGFRNPNPDFINHGFSDFLKWTFTRFSNPDSNDPSDYEFSTTPNRGEKLRSFQGKWSVTWIGHAGTLVQLGAKNILTDPIWSDRCSPVSWAGPKRYTQPGIAMDDLPPIHAVIVSHNHYDHMDIPSLRELEKRFQPHFFVGLGNKEFLESVGLTYVHEMDWWEKYSLEELTIHFTPTQHFSARGLTDRDRTLWGSFVLDNSQSKVYFAGDTGYFSGFSEIARRMGKIDLAILPIGAYRPRWFMESVHVDPIQSVQAFVDLEADYMLPMHYQTFVLSDEALDEPLKLTRKTFQEKNLDEKRLLPLKIGESFLRD